MDVEGVENKIINELEKSSKINKVKKIILEYHYNEGFQENSLDDILNILKRNDFEIKVISAEAQLLVRNNLQYNSMVYARKVK